MFIKYRIMRHIEYGEYYDLVKLCKTLRYANFDKFTKRTDSLGRAGFLSYNELGHITHKCLSSFSEYKASLRKIFFEISVSVASIIVAITSVIAVILQCKSLLLSAIPK